MNDGNGLAVLRCEHRRGDGAVKDVPRMPMAGAVIVCCFDDRASYRGVGEVGVVMMCVMMVRFDGAVIMVIITIIIVIMILSVVVAVEVDVQVIAAGVVVKIECGA